MLIVFAGPPCAGKSTLAAELARRLALPHLEMDAVRARILPDAPHTRADRAAAYRAMAWAAELLERHGAGAILDAPYGHREDRGAIPVPFYLIECAVTVECAVRRFRERGPDEIRRDLTEARVRELVAEYPYSRAGLVVWTERQTTPDYIAAIERYLQSAKPVEPGTWL